MQIGGLKSSSNNSLLLHQRGHRVCQVPMTAYQAPQVQSTTPKAQSASQTATCPDCNSDNYFGFNGSKPRCYECGYPMEQSGSKYGSLTGARVEGDTKGARGNDATNNYNPQGIIGRVN